MSSWIYIECPCCKAEHYSVNVTWNLSPMWAEAGIFEALKKSTGKRAKEIVDAITAGLALMEADPERFKKLEPPNGWGVYDGAIRFLREYTRALRCHPEMLIRVSG